MSTFNSTSSLLSWPLIPQNYEETKAKELFRGCNSSATNGGNNFKMGFLSDWYKLGGFFLTGYFSEVPSETAPVAPKSAFWLKVEQFKPTRTERGGKYYFKRQSFSISRPCFNAVKWNTSANRNKWGKWRKISPLCIRREAERRKLEVYLGKDLGFFLFFFLFFMNS